MGASPAGAETGGGPPGATLVVTISSTYGAGGSVVGPDVAERLGLPFVGSVVVPSDLAGAATEGSEGAEGLAADERGDSVLRRLIVAAARMPGIIGVAMPQPSVGMSEEERFKAANEAGMAQLLATTGAVIRGRGGAAFLGDDPRCFHVRLDGPVERRIRQAMRIEGIGETEARERQAETDRVRSLYLRRFYDRDASDPTMYHLMLDSTVVALAVCTDLIAIAAIAARAARGGVPGPPG
jgi:cytidylate kinase